MAKTTAEAIKAFKTFVKKHPELVKGVNKQHKSWNDVFDEWVLFGEDHEIWEEYGIEMGNPKKKPRGANEFMRFVDFISHLDAKNVHERLDQLNGTLTGIQDVITQFQPDNSQPQNQQQTQQPGQGMPQNPYNYGYNQQPGANGAPYQPPPFYRRD